MGCLVFTIVAGLLCWVGVFSVEVFLCIAIGSMVWMFGAAFLYFKFGFLDWFYHDMLEWHTPAKEDVNGQTVCKYCGKYITMDSQGNWF